MIQRDYLFKLQTVQRRHLCCSFFRSLSLGSGNAFGVTQPPDYYACELALC